MGQAKLPRIMALLVAIVLLVAACSSDDDEGTTTTTAGGDTGDVELINAGTLSVCSDIPYEPFEFEKDGDYAGYDIDLLRAIGDANNWELKVQVTPFDGILGSLEAGDCDIVASALTITEERAKQVDYTESYFDADQSLLIKKADEATYVNLADLAGQTIGVQSGTTGEEYAQENTPQGATIRSFEGAAELFSALEAGEIQAILQDFPVNAYRATQDDTVTVSEQFPTEEQYGFAVKKGNSSLKNAINAGLNDMRDSGEFNTIFKQYFGTDAPS